MSAHTPGPWFVPQSFGTQYVEARIDSGRLQEVAACGPTQEPTQQYANARLIAAAPALLEALEDLLMHIGKGREETVEWVCEPIHSDEIKAARAAIAAAKGEQ